MRRALLLPVLLISALLGGAGTAQAEPATPSAQPPATAVPLLTLTAIPNGWQTRVDLRPELQVYADGRAVRVPDAIAANRAPDATPREVEGTVPADVLKAAVSETAELAKLDLGMPSVSDQGSRIIDVMPAQDAEAVHAIVYAPGFTDGLNDDQKKARDRFDRLYRTVIDAFEEKR
ncbi:hypothetical protein [Nocardia harenae]|uniref:hypothetical protein n=1 Tax=Nocardia harenae TaxID=358707 RepID=UPI000832E240|nr:hypothetical protein [Nocardia harenae]